MSWTPLENTQLSAHYPNTPSLKCVDSGLTDYFHKQSMQKKMVNIDTSSIHILLVKGLMGDYMLNHFKAVKTHFIKQGYDVSVAPTSGTACIASNAKAIGSHIAKIHKNTYLFCHSKGGLEALTALDTNKHLLATIKGVILVQTPFGISPVLNSILVGAYPRNNRTRLKENFLKYSLKLLSASDGCYDLIEPNIKAYLKDYHFAFPVIQFATWSIYPTSWVDSFHKRLNEIDMGVAHDGQFYVHEMLWPCFPNILVGGIDHAQPAVGGYGFAPERFWERCFDTLKSIRAS